MCGIAGYFSPTHAQPNFSRIAAMTRAIRHRGPDDEGLVVVNSQTRRSLDAGGGAASIERLDPQCGPTFAHDIALGQTRFSIVDLSDAGHQPFWNHERSAVVVFNGEIYNHVELREDLEKRGHTFRSRSDTEVLLTAYEEWGLDCLERFNGPWAFALYDLRRRRLVLSRDRIGKAPLYHATRDGVLYFASEIKALRAAEPAITSDIDEEATRNFVDFGWRDVDCGTFYRGIRSLEAASYAIIEREPRVRPVRFWSLPGERLGKSDIGFAEAATELRSRLTESIRLRLRADVSIAMELSGGLDSSSLVALRASLPNEEGFPAYCVRFGEPGSNEEPFARAVAERHGRRVDYRVIDPPQTQFWEHADGFVSHMDEPFHSPNLMTNQRLRRTIRGDGFRVVMSGAGGDEVLAGYDEYRFAFLTDLAKRGRLGRLAHELSTGGGTKALVRSWLPKRPERANPTGNRLLASPRRTGGPPSDFSGLLRENFERWMLPKWLRSGNTAQYAIPSEPRVPFLDYRVVEFAFSLPGEYLIRDGFSKAVLREALAPLLPESVARRRRKMGFPFPHRPWLAASKRVLLANVAGVDPPGVDLRPLPDAYDALVEADPHRLWRMASVALWHKRVNLGSAIDPDPR